MKKRIFSFFLAVVMLFSCLSLNIFAAGEETATPTSEPVAGTVLYDTLDAHTDNEILTLIKANEKFAKRVWIDGKTDQGVALKSDGEKLVKNKGNVETRLDVSSHTSLSGRDNLLANLPANRDYLGQSFVVQLDFVLSQEFLDLTSSERPLVQINNYAAKRSNTLKHSALQTNIVVVKNGFLQARRGADTKYPNGDYSNAAPVFDTLVQLKANTEYTLSVFVDPKGGNAEDGVYGTYNVYLNSELICENQSLFCEIENNVMTMPEDVPFFFDGAWDGKIAADQIVSYFFTDTLPTEEEFNAIIAKSNLSFTPLYKNAKAIGTVKGVKDFANGFVRLFQNTVNYTQDNVYSLDNVMVYYADSFVGTLVDHSIKNSHKHDFAQSTTEVTYFCELCDGEKVVVKSLDANGDRICDVCVGGLDAGGTISHSELMNAIGSTNIIYDTDMSNIVVAPNATHSTPQKDVNNGKTDFRVDNYHGIFSIVEENGNSYLKCGAPTGTPPEKAGNNYAQSWNNVFGSRTNLQSALKSGDKRIGSTYVLSIDYAFYGKCDASFLQIASYTASDEYAATGNNAVSFQPLRIIPEGNFYYRDAATNQWVDTKKVFSPGEFHNIVFVHSPSTNSFDLFFDGELVANDVKALSDDYNKNSIEYTAPDGTHYTGTALFTPSFVRFAPQLTNHTYGDVYAIDNFRLYYAEKNLDCIHKFDVAHEHDVANNVNKVTYTCEYCENVQSFDVPIVDLSGKMLSVSDIKASGLEVMKASDFNAGTLDVWGTIDDKAIRVAGGENGDYHLEWYKQSDTVSSAIQAIAGSAGTREHEVKNFDRLHGKSYVMSADFVISPDNSAEIRRVFQVLCYLGSSDQGKTLSAVFFDPIDIAASGEIEYRDGSKSGDQKSGIFVSAGVEHTIAVYHTPAGDKFSPENTYDIYLDGELVLENITALDSSKNTSMSWTAATTKLNGSYTVDEGFKVEGAKDFIPGLFRYFHYVPSVKAGSAHDVSLTVDNIKNYYTDTFIECKHSFTDSNVCDWCGFEAEIDESYCEICDGTVISENVAITGRSATLGELIDMNVYAAIANDKVSPDTEVTITCGDKTETVLVKDAEKTEKGYKFSISLNSTQMKDEVTLKIDGATYTTSIADYALALIEAGDKAAPVAKALLNYGAAAQTYFAAKNGDETLDDVLANAGLAEADKVVPALDAETLAKYAFVQEGATDEVHFTAVKLQLSTTTHMKLYFTAPKGATVTVDGEDARVYYDTVAKEYMVFISDITPTAATGEKTVVITAGDVTVTATVSAFTAVSAGANGTSASLADLMNAYGQYCLAASAYAN